MTTPNLFAPAVFNHEPGATTSRVARDTKTFKPTVESTKRLRRVLDLSYDSRGLVEINVPQVVEKI